MKLNAKFLIILLIVALGPIALVAGIAQSQMRSESLFLIEEQLASLASTKDSAVEELVQAYTDRLTGLVGRTKLRDLLSQSSGTPSVATRLSIARIMNEGIEPYSDIESAFIVNTQEEIIYQSGVEITEAEHILSESENKREVFFSESMNNIVVSAHFVRGEQNLGTLFVVFNHAQLDEILIDYHGLHDTGEMLLAYRDEFGNARFMHHRRFEDVESARVSIDRSETNIPMTQALLQHEEMYRNVIDYRGESVIAATRYIPSADWGIVVKIDQEEVLGRVQPFRLTLLIFSALVIFFAFILILIFSRSLIRPIRELQEISNMLAGGKLDHPIPRTLLMLPNEIGDLARTFEKMTTELRKMYNSLNEEVEKKTQQLRESLTTIEEVKNRFEGAFEYSAIGIALVSLEGRWLRVNKALTNILGYSKEEFETLTFQEITHPDDLDADLEYVQQMLAGEISTYQMDKRYYHKLGHELWTQLNVSLIRDEKGEPMYFISQIQDVTKLKEVDRAKTEFVSLASHQLRTPLTSLRWFSEILLKGGEGLNTEQREQLDIIHESTERMVSLVNDLLDMSRLELGTFKVTPEEINVCSTLNDVVGEFDTMLQEKNLTMNVTCGTAIPEQMMFDEKLLFIIMENLISNAVKYNRKDGTIDVSLDVRDDRLIFEVKDTGYGIPSAQQNQIFTKLFRADNILSKDTEGTGLGLYMSKSIIDSTNGTISFTSKENEGTTFTVTYPMSGMTPRDGSKELRS